jgi:H+/Cl- antiporter ClcA
MKEPPNRSDPPVTGTQPEEADVLRNLLRSRQYLKVLVASGFIGIPVSLVAFWFLALIHELEHAVWADLPKAWGWDAAPWWWPLPLLLVAGIAVGLVATHLPGAGGHLPASGLHPGGPSSAALPGVLLAAVASLPLGAVLGPEAPLIALGAGLALLLQNLARLPATPQTTALLGAAGAAAAISAIFGNPLIAAVLLIEITGVAKPLRFAVMLPALLSSGIGALVFTGLGSWTGLATGDLSLKLSVPPPRLEVAEVLWALAIAIAIATVLRPLLAGGRLIACYVGARPLARTVLCALGAAICAALYALVTGRSPTDVASSGVGTLAAMAADPQAWGGGALLAIVVFKSLAYMLCLGGLRGGPVFPALFLGAAAGLLLAPGLGLGVIPAMAAGMAAATTSVLRLPLGSVVLVAVLLDSATMMPVVILASVVAFVITEVLSPGRA